MTERTRRTLHVLTYVAVAVLLAVFARHVDWRAAESAVRSADLPLLVLAAALSLLSLTLKGVRWWVFLRAIGVRSLGLVLRATYAGASLNNLLVAQGGEGARVLIVARAAGVSSAGVLAALALERALDMLSYLLLLVGAAWLLPVPPALARWRGPAAATLGVALVLVVILAVRGESHAGAPPGSGRVRAYLHGFRAAATAVASPLRLGVGALLSLAAWALQVATYHVVALAAHSALPLAGSVSALLAVGISFLFRATPGNVGVFQMVYAVAAGAFGVNEGAAVAVAGLIQLVQVGPTVLVGTLAAPLRARPAGPAGPGIAS
jgi:uncharacterized protein (TIRG00374 family)